MSFQEDNHAGIPTRAIHEAYLDMQRALKQHRQATDRGGQAATDYAHGELQESVLTFFEMLRPHLQRNSRGREYWEGEPPPYPEDGRAPQPQEGKAILAWQQHTHPFQLNGTDPDGLTELAEWHEELDIADTARLTGYQLNGSVVFAAYHTYEMGLYRLDGWQTEFTTTQTDIGGFMGGKQTTQAHRQRVPIQKLRRAARALSTAADRLDFLSHTDDDRDRYHAGGEKDHGEPFGTAKPPE